MRYEVTADAAKALASLWDEITFDIPQALANAPQLDRLRGDLLVPPSFRWKKPSRWNGAAVDKLLTNLCEQWKQIAMDGEGYGRWLRSEDAAAVAMMDNKRRRVEHAQLAGAARILEREGLYTSPVRQAIEAAKERNATVPSVIFEGKPKPIKPAARNIFERDAARVLFALGWNITDTATEIERLLREFDFRELSRQERNQLPDAASIASRIRGLYKK